MIDLAALPDLAAMDDDALLAHLAALADDLDATRARLDALHERRLAVYKNARGRSPAVTQRRIAEASRVTEVAVIQALRKDAKARAS